MLTSTFSSSPSPFSVQLEQAKKRVDFVENLRKSRAISANNANFNHVFNLLPLLLHFNHPDLAGFTPHAPQGIEQFSLNAYQQTYLENHHADPTAYQASNTPRFDGLYVMGSIGSISQTSISDLDLWLCHSGSFSAAEQQLIEQKLAKITRWAKGFEVDLHFYLINPKNFHFRQADNEVNSEHCGSSQHFILLDEFYRSVIRLSGKRLLWLHIAESKQPYEKVLQQAIARGELNLDEWIDFGDFSALSASEFFGAALWQLYKGIRSPYKSALKILLLESYADRYPDIPLISKAFKQQLFRDDFTQYHFDPYLAMLEQVSAYLTQKQEFERLNLLRCHFYIKAKEGKQQHNWRMEKLAQLVQEWGWSAQETRLLENKDRWKVKQVSFQHRIIVGQLLLGYRNLIQFARKTHLDPSILSGDSDILMRQLYSMFENLPDKLTLFHPSFIPQLAEPHLTFIQVENNIAAKSGWYLLNQAPKMPYDPQLRYMEYQKDLGKLVAWAYFNGLITLNTRIHLVSKTLEKTKLHQFITDLRLSFPSQAPELSHYDLHHPHEIRNLSVFVNLEKDPTKYLKLPKYQLSLHDMFKFSSTQQNLIGSITLIYRNLWNELRIKHFDGDDAIFKTLKLISNKIYLNSAPPRVVNVYCYSQYLRSELRDFIADLVNKYIYIQPSKIFQKQQLSASHLNEKAWQFVFPNQPLAEVKKDEFPREIDEFASEGFLQFFFQDNPNGTFNVYILDEKNRIESYFQCENSKEAKAQEIYRLHTHKHRDDKNSIESFNFPQFYQLLTIDGKTRIVPFQSRQHREYMG